MKTQLFISACNHCIHKEPKERGKSLLKFGYSCTYKGSADTLQVTGAASATTAGHSPTRAAVSGHSWKACPKAGASPELSLHTGLLSQLHPVCPPMQEQKVRLGSKTVRTANTFTIIALFL